MRGNVLLFSHLHLHTMLHRSYAVVALVMLEVLDMHLQPLQYLYTLMVTSTMQPKTSWATLYNSFIVTLYANNRKFKLVYLVHMEVNKAMMYMSCYTRTYTYDVLIQKMISQSFGQKAELSAGNLSSLLLCSLLHWVPSASEGQHIPRGVMQGDCTLEAFLHPHRLIARKRDLRLLGKLLKQILVRDKPCSRPLTMAC